MENADMEASLEDLHPHDLRKMEHKHEMLSYHQIDEFLYAGNNMCCQTHFKSELLSKGISADISLELERLDNPEGVKYFFWLPWEDKTPPTEELVKIAMGVMKNLRDKKIKTYVHCRNGHGRTSTFLSIYFMHFYGLNADKALKKVLETRPSAHWNDEQENFIRGYYKNNFKKRLLFF
jgi:protein tyrosine phosphatase